MHLPLMNQIYRFIMHQRYAHEWLDYLTIHNFPYYNFGLDQLISEYAPSTSLKKKVSSCMAVKSS